MVYDSTKDAYGSFTFPAKTNGRYEVCFENQMNQARRISFNELGHTKPDPNRTHCRMCLAEY